MSSSSSQSKQKSSTAKKQKEQILSTKVPPAISVLKVYDNNKFNCHNHAICKSKSMDLKALKIHVTSSSVYSCFINVIEPRMAPVENKDIICPPKNEVIEYNKANMKFVCGHCYVTGTGGTSRSIGVMGLYTNRCGSNRLKPSCIK